MVQFEKLEKLRNIDISELWSLYKDRFPKVEEHPVSSPVVERFAEVAPPLFQFEVQSYSSPPMPRYWFVNESGTELVQVQQDRFAYNWRSQEGNDNYPRYHAVKERFSELFHHFRKFIEGSGLGKIEINQCEVTYSNHIPCEHEWSGFGDIDKVIAPWSGQNSDDFLGIPEEVSLSTTYLIPGERSVPLGRLRINAQPAFRISDRKKIVRLILVARGNPSNTNVDGISEFFDVCHDWIVRGFTSFTESSIHSNWERKQ